MITELWNRSLELQIKEFFFFLAWRVVVRNRIIVEHTALRSYYPNEPPTGEVFGELRATQKNWTPENHGTRRGKESQYRWGEQGRPK